MNSFHSLTQQLALQADRKILQAEEEEYLRLDLSAHEKATWSALALARTSPWIIFKRFSLTALAFYLILFSLTNAEAYSKIALTNIQESWEERQNSVPISEAPVLSLDPWTGHDFESVLLKTTQAQVPASVPQNYLPPLSTPLSYENRLQISSLNINAPIIEPSLGLTAIQNKDWEALESQIHESLKSGIVHFPGTAEPGQKGNALLTGHSSNVFWEVSDYNTVFALLPKIKIGDEILITYNQTEYRYTVTGKKEVSPKDVSVLKQGDTKTLTLVTCTPVGTTLRRLIVTAELQEALD